MKKLSVLLCLVLLSACAPSEVPVDKLVERNGITYEVNSQTPFTGASIEYYENGQLNEKINYKDGMQHGLVENYHEDGELSIKTNYKDGEKHGLAEVYRENGQLSGKVNWKDGTPHGLAESYDEDGKEYSSPPQCYQNGAEVDMSNCK
ncbi:hypothetical protein N9R09_03360 [Porticoccaceae bacterium]|nr:hypothetical protein [Porticoccaceae bacterium]